MDRAIVKQGFITSFDKSDIILPYIQDDFNKIKNDVDVPAGTTSNALNRAKVQSEFESKDPSFGTRWDNEIVSRQILGGMYNGGAPSFSEITILRETVKEQEREVKKDFFDFKKITKKETIEYSREAGYSDVSRKAPSKRCPKWK